MNLNDPEEVLELLKHHKKIEVARILGVHRSAITHFIKALKKREEQGTDDIKPRKEKQTKKIRVRYYLPGEVASKTNPGHVEIIEAVTAKRAQEIIAEKYPGARVKRAWTIDIL